MKKHLAFFILFMIGLSTSHVIQGQATARYQTAPDSTEKKEAPPFYFKTDEYREGLYRVHPSAIITHAAPSNPTEKRILYWASRTGVRLLERRTGTYATGPYPETPAARPRSTGPRRASELPR